MMAAFFWAVIGLCLSIRLFEGERLKSLTTDLAFVITMEYMLTLMPMPTWWMTLLILKFFGSFQICSKRTFIWMHSKSGS